MNFERTKKRRNGMRKSWGLLMAAAVAGMAAPGALAQEKPAPTPLVLSGPVDGTHDPSIATEDGRYYVFATGAVRPEQSEGAAPAQVDRAMLPQLPVRCSDDLHTWRRCGAVFSSMPEWIRQISPTTQDLWAPDVSYFDGLWHLYYAFSIFGKNTSGIGLATTTILDPKSPNFKWVDRGLVVRSVATDDFNAIDPNVILDAKGAAWLSFGSFWSGIKMRRLDAKTGLLSTTDKKMYALASRREGLQAIEAPFVFHHGKYFYLFVSFDKCCRGANSSYRTMVGRSKKVTGPYVDRDGKRMLAGGGSQVLAGNMEWAGPGGESLLHTGRGDFMVFHAYSVKDGHPALHISTVEWKDGWPEVALDRDGR